MVEYNKMNHEQFSVFPRGSGKWGMVRLSYDSISSDFRWSWVMPACTHSVWQTSEAPEIIITFILIKFAVSWCVSITSFADWENSLWEVEQLLTFQVWTLPHSPVSHSGSSGLCTGNKFHSFTGHLKPVIVLHTEYTMVFLIHNRKKSLM